ncbi:unnamed protein product [Toxocara canis]|uniref:TPX2_importin domain-containing protein n=1 Tax=Toxocara canis TaxID=6265 RepID=A0A183V8G8_TOXCA|nr:unnamed protein product [Toxocara canis]
MLTSDDVYDIPSVPKFADLRRLGQGEPSMNANNTLGDAFFDISGVLVGGISPHNPYGQNASAKVDKKQEVSGANKENEPTSKEGNDDSDDSMFGIRKLAMFRQPQPRRRAASVETAGAAQVANQHSVKQRAASTDPPKGKLMIPSANNEVRRPAAVRRSAPAPLPQVPSCRIRHASGDTYAKSDLNKNNGPAKVRVAQRMVGVTTGGATQRRLQRADPALYHGPETRARTKIDKRVITPVSNVDKAQSEKRREGSQTYSDNRQRRLGTAISSKPAQAFATQGGPSAVDVRPPRVEGPAGNVKVAGNAEAAAAVDGGHVARERTRRAVVGQKGPIRLQKMPADSSKGLSAVVSERRFRESVTRRERGGESLEREANIEQHHAQQRMVIVARFSQGSDRSDLPVKRTRLVSVLDHRCGIPEDACKCEYCYSILKA